MYMILFGVTFVVLLAFQTGIERLSYRKLGKCEMEIKSSVEKMDLLTHFFRASLCIIVALYYTYRNGHVFSYGGLTFTIILAALASKIFFPVITISCFSDACGIYENGVMTLCGTKIYGDLKSFSVHEREYAVLKDNQMVFVFQSRMPYLSRPSYVYVNRRKYNQAERLLARKFHIKKL
ncbi:MAG: hypothetical protein HFH53_11065 [Hespellia sp.]|jgi:hypothetical protein|nr:hypothetical protein [Hespellia sp.]